MSDRVSQEAFEQRYASLGDPWNFATSPYEQGRYARVIDALSKSGYDVVYEPGCSIGELTVRLAAIAHRVLATDLAPSAVAKAVQRCAHLPNVTVICEDVAHTQPEGPVDLIVFSEIGYYFEPLTLDRISARLACSLAPGGEFLAAHWLGHSADHRLHGDVVHDRLKLNLPLRWFKGERFEHFRIDSWLRCDP